MDDLKLYASAERDLQQSLRVVQEYSRAVGMEFGLDKCALVHLKRGRMDDYGEDAQLVDGSILHHLDAGETYTYLGVEQRSTHEVGVPPEEPHGSCTRKGWLLLLFAMAPRERLKFILVTHLLYSPEKTQKTRNITNSRAGEANLTLRHTGDFLLFQGNHLVEKFFKDDIEHRV
ncbi:hypothetical protein NQ317_016121 [Molorchus minor]|uniref:Reverse transcriptase domain-containing protein n=1 Tax=Molorchus minor TaxID=1323400 RepID=A0ABQ9IPN3_9CUCU|nr:hypothetical protein NQ317_016121 [Molorchus minor]